MEINTKSIALKLLKDNGVDPLLYSNDYIQDFLSEEEITSIESKILDLQNKIMSNWKIKTRNFEFMNSTIRVPNATQNSPYSFCLGIDFIEKNQLESLSIKGLEECNLNFDQETLTISGQPIINGAITLKFYFKVIGEYESQEDSLKEVILFINPDPKLLWKNIPSDTEALFWKDDNDSTSASFGERSIVVSSKRGRSHQNVGSFRDDDYALQYFKHSKWGAVAVSDGAGSAKFSRKGSQLACQKVIEYFQDEMFDNTERKNFEQLLNEYVETKNEDTHKIAETMAMQLLYKATVYAHKSILECAQLTNGQQPEAFEKEKVKNLIDAFHSTLIFVLFKKFDFGYVILSFGVGDCPIGIVSKDLSEAKMLNWLDVGEFGGGTRFITQNEIFHSKERPMQTRFNMHIQEDFSFLFLMTDGIYDPKFVVEANLEKTEKWIEFIDDLKGNNEDNVAVDFSADLKTTEDQLNQWMDFWSRGNHDDRTLAIIY